MSDVAGGQQRVAVVTGAGSGIGAAIAGTLAARGLLVVVTDVDEGAAREVASRITSDPGGARTAVHRRLDVTDGAAVAACCAEVETTFGGPDVWVSNAGISKMQAFVDVAEEDLDRTLGVNLRAPFVCGQVAARSMLRRGTAGAIVNVASMAGKQGRVPYLADYVASKFGVVGLTQAMAFELAGAGIRVNCVCPGYVATPMQARETAWEAALRGIGSDAVVASWIADTPLGRLEQPDDVARAVAFLVSEDAAFITGEALAVNGGAYMD